MNVLHKHHWIITLREISRLISLDMINFEEHLIELRCPDVRILQCHYCVVIDWQGYFSRRMKQWIIDDMKPVGAVKKHLPAYNQKIVFQTMVGWDSLFDVIYWIHYFYIEIKWLQNNVMKVNQMIRADVIPLLEWLIENWTLLYYRFTVTSNINIMLTYIY